jgi:hypothetical protein
MNRFEGTAARQLDLVDPDEVPLTRPLKPAEPPPLRLLRRQIYAELSRRRRRAQIAARHWVDK